MLARLGSWSPALQRLLLVIGCALLFCVWLTRVPLLEVDETRYTTASRTMAETGDYIIPRYNGKPRYQKPILFYWVQSTSLRLLGPSEFAARLPSGLGGILLVLIAHSFLLRWLPLLAGDDPRRRMEARGAAMLGGMALATLPLFAFWTRSGVTDVTLTLFITMSLLGVLQADLARRVIADEAAGLRAVRGWYLLAVFSCGLAFLTKGPIAVLILVLTWFLYHLRQGTLRDEAGRVPWIAAVPLFLLVAAPWYVATYLRDGGEFLRQFFFTENLARYAGSGGEAPGLLESLSKRAGDMIAYLLVVLLFLHPYGAFIAHELSERGQGLSHGLLLCMRRFAWTWIVVAVGFILLSKTQYPNYVQNISVAAIIVFALYLLQRAWSAAPRRAGTLPVTLLVVYTGLWWFFASLLLLPEKPAWVVRLLGKFRPNPWALPYPPQVPEALLVAVAVASLLVLASVVVFSARRAPLPLIGGVMAAWAAFFALVLHGVAPIYYASQFGAVARAGAAIARIADHQPTVVYHAYDPPEDLVYYGRRTMMFVPKTPPEKLDYVREALAEHGRLLVVTDAAGLEQVATLGETTVLREEGYFLAVDLRARAAAP